ncbi:MAG: Hpt domain-containing protein [Rhodocyclaceae bacterium]|nr:Hpt domain-containing protein [Rhodocyclaceae bacterium]MDZ4216020.1 Hpt domain-containing protein [Rhodocyclaceae bacterium]
MNAPAFDTGTLSWVKDEIDLALERAGAALSRHAAAPDNAATLNEARGHLHQACGALTLVGLAGVTHCAETVETQLASLADPAADTNVVAVTAAAGAALSALRRYLDDLMAGHPDQPLRLYPAYRGLALAAGQAAPSPLVLFQPDLGLRPPRREATSALPPVRLKALRLGFARGLAKWRTGETRGLTEMKNALVNLEQSLSDPGQRAPWWVALAWFEALEGGGEPQDELLTGLEQLFAEFADGKTSAPPTLLMKGLLYAIALAPPGGAQLESVRAAYRLADLLPTQDATIETRREACRAPLTTAMEEWERFSQGQAIALMRFHDVVQLLAATANESNDPALARLVGAIAAFAAWLRQQPERADARLALDVAGALVLVEEVIEREGLRSPADEAMFVAAVQQQIDHLDALKPLGATPPPLARLPWRERQLQAQVAAEIRRSLEVLESLLEPCFEQPGPAIPARAQAVLHEVAGAFVLLDAHEAAAVAAATTTRLMAANASADAYAIVAHHLAALAQYTDALQHGQDATDVLAPLAAAAATTVTPTATAAPTLILAPVAPVAADSGDDMLAIFIEEAHEVLQTLAAAVPALKANPADREMLTTVRRAYHTLKGSGRMVGLTELGEAAFAVEKQINQRLDERLPVDTDLMATIDAAGERFAAWIAELETRKVGVGETAAAAPPDVNVPATVTIGELTLSPMLYQLYVEEAGTHVAALRQELSGPASIPSRELIRAAHTLAGISAGTGFPTVQVLAHALENVLVRHSLAHIVPEETARMLIARAAGALQGMVGAITERRPPAAEPELAATLEACQPAAPAPQEAPPPISPLAERRTSRPADEVDPQLAPLFLEEADEQLHQLDADLRAWREAPQDKEPGRRMARLLHTFKGGARMCGAMGIGELAHSMETRIEQALATGGAQPDVLEVLDTSLGRALSLVAALRPGAAPLEAPAPTMAEPVESGPAGAQVLLRVRADLIDRLVSEAGEMAITRGRVEGSLKDIKGGLLDLADNIVRLRAQLREFEMHAETSMQSRLGGSVMGADGHQRDFDPLELDRFTRLQELTRMLAESVNDVSTLQHGLLRQADGAGEALVIQSRQQRELAHALLRARMVPFVTVDERLHRVVRQTAKELGRQANLDIRGGDTPVDRNVLERMLGPLEHLLRNAVAHGIEAPEQRHAAGKAELGQIVLTIVATDNDITLRLQDDGKGLDYAAIRQRASERGLLSADEPMENAQLAELIFRPGFSTAASVSEIAGRGVGLDVVRDEVTQLGGQVAVSGAAGRGTTFEMILPLTLAVIPVMLVEAAGQRWAIPVTMVEEARELDAEEAAAREAAGAVTRNGLRYPWHTLPQLFRMADTDTVPAWQLLLKHGGMQVALAVEALTQNQEVVVKPLGEQLQHVPGLAGATVLPDGCVALIINPVVLAQRLGQAIQPAPTFATSTMIRAAQAPTVMVVDDSLTVRKITSRLLERAGYCVTTAKDGEDALAKIVQHHPAVILADIEMPRMDGFELVRHLRADPQLTRLPVIMITSRIADKHRQVALELGVQHYLGKPYDEDQLLDLIASLVKSS